MMSRDGIRSGTATANGPSSSGHLRRNCLKEEELIVRRRNAESDRYQLWSGVDDYFKTWDVHISQFSNWSSPEFFNYIDNSRLKEVEAQKRREHLEIRRQSLMALLTKEESEYKKQILNLQKNKFQKMNVNEDNLFGMNLEFKHRMDEAVRREKELKLYHHFNFPHPDQYHKQYAYFTKKAISEEEKKNVMKNDKICSVNSSKRNLDMIVANDKVITERELIISSNNMLKTEIECSLKELEKLEEKKKKLKFEEVKMLEHISEVRKCFRVLMNEDESNRKQLKVTEQLHENLSTSAGFLKLWRKKSKRVQNELKEQIKFLEIIYKVADLVKDFSFKYEVEKHKHKFLKKIQMESGRERLSDLFECTYKEPSIWWKEENKMWKDDEEDRKSQLECLYSKLETMEKNWNHRNLQEQKLIIAKQENILADLDQFKKDIESNERLFEQLHITN